MKARVIRLDFSKHPILDPQGLSEDKFTKPYLIQTKKHWWSRWEYVIDNQTYVPRLFFGKESVIDFCLLNKLKIVL